jgi:glycosyltransferase involved in cell wall biosynthesis
MGDVKPNPLVSVVIPAYNVERYLGEAIESVLAQTYRSIELIVVDDGSTDATAEVATSFADVKLIRQPNRGLAAARNAGFEASAGRFVCFHDADDMMVPAKISKQVDLLSGHPDAEIVLCAQEILVEEGAELPFWHGDTTLQVRRPAPKDGIAAGAMVHTTSSLIRREAFDRVGGFDPAIGHAEDIDWLFRAREAGVRVHVCEEPLLRRRVRAGSITQDPVEGRTAIFRAIKARFDRERAAI